MPTQQIECPWCRGTGKALAIKPPEGMSARDFMTMPPPRPMPTLTVKECHVCEGSCLCSEEKATEFLELHQAVCEMADHDDVEIDYAEMIAEVEAGGRDGHAAAIEGAFATGPTEPVPKTTKPRETPRAE